MISFSGCNVPKTNLPLLKPRICNLRSFCSKSEEVNRRKINLRTENSWFTRAASYGCI